MTRDEAKTLPLGTLVRYREGRSAATRFARLVSTDGYKIAEVEAGGGYGLPLVRLRKRYEEIEVFATEKPEPGASRPARRGR